MDLLFLPIVNNKSNVDDELLINIEPPKQCEEKGIIIQEDLPTKKKYNKNNKVHRQKFLEKNKEKIKEKVQCPICYSTYTYFNKSKHFKTKRHLTLSNVKSNNTIKLLI